MWNSSSSELWPVYASNSQRFPWLSTNLEHVDMSIWTGGSSVIAWRSPITIFYPQASCKGKLLSEISNVTTSNKCGL